MHQFNPLVCDETILEALLRARMGVNELARNLHRNKRTVIRHLKRMESYGYVVSRRVGKRKIYELTELGRDACAYFRIKRDVGYIGLEWAKSKAERGFKVRFLSDLTGLSQHKRWLFAWNPKTGECDLAAIFGVRSLMNKKGEGPRYLAQYVDRKKSPDKPLKSAELFEYLKQNVKDWSDEGLIQKALKAFWNTENFNAYFCVFMPEEVGFGFPTEIGHFGSLLFIGFGYQQDFPFIPQMDIVVGGFNLSENLKVQIKYQINLMMMYIYSWLVAKKVIDPASIPDETIELAGASMVKFHTRIACKNGQDGKCSKMGIRCLAQTEKGLDFSKCPILVEEVKQVEIFYKIKNAEA